MPLTFMQEDFLVKFINLYFVIVIVIDHFSINLNRLRFNKALISDQSSVIKFRGFKHLNYHPRLQKGNNFSWVCLSLCVSVCISVCLSVQAITLHSQELYFQYTDTS